MQVRRGASAVWGKGVAGYGRRQKVLVLAGIRGGGRYIFSGLS